MSLSKQPGVLTGEMPAKTKAQLRDELDEAEQELAEVKASSKAEVDALKESKKWLRKTEERLKKELEMWRR